MSLPIEGVANACAVTSGAGERNMPPRLPSRQSWLEIWLGGQIRGALRHALCPFQGVRPPAKYHRYPGLTVPQPAIILVIGESGLPACSDNRMQPEVGFLNRMRKGSRTSSHSVE